MANVDPITEQTPLQDTDLLLRMSLYFDALEQRLRRGQGWFIFNASDSRSERISRFIAMRLEEMHQSVSAYLMPWRDFALSAYVNEIGLPELAPPEPDTFASMRAREEYQIAKRVTDETRDRLLFSDLVVLVGLRPSAWHEAIFLDRTIDERYRNRLATILLTPEMPSTLQEEFATLDPSQTFWPRLFERMYETSLVAL
jgi:hypothetical protein